MIGVVLAAGAARRLRPDTDRIPKTLLTVDGERTILDLILENLATVGIREVTVVVGFAADAIVARREALARRYGVSLTLVANDRAEEWNNAYSLWLARDPLAAGALLVNGDTVHPAGVEETLLAARGPDLDLLLAVDDRKPLADEEMKVVFDGAGQLVRIHKSVDPAAAHGEYLGAAVIEPGAAAGLAEALADTWRADPGRYYEDGFQVYADRGGRVRGVPVGTVSWVEVDDHADLARAREITAGWRRG